MRTRTYIILFIFAAIVGMAIASAVKGTSQIAESISEATQNPLAPPPDKFSVRFNDGSYSECLSEREARRLYAHRGGTLLYCRR